MKAILIWIIVAAPLVWGVTKSVQKSLPLFRGDAAKPAATAPAK